MKSAPPLDVLADAGTLGIDALPAAVATMARAGIGWIQLRMKTDRGQRPLTDTARVDAARACLDARDAAAADGPRAALWINDRVDLALLLDGFDGVHLGQDDLPPADARALLGPDHRIGRSTHDLPQLAAAAADPAVDVIAVGPVFATVSKPDASPVVGLDLVRRARAAAHGRPVVAIGGIDASNLRAVRDAGADTVAVLGAACGGGLADLPARLAALQDALAPQTVETPA
ncbi:MAG: thiamine phosphate synthase [Acidobacteriota bacterium]